MRALLLVTITMLAACPLQGTHNATLGGGSSSTPSSAPSSPAERERPVRAGEGENAAPYTKAYLEADEMKSLKGLTVDQAKARAKQLGHKGEVEVRKEDEFVEGCKPNTVCEVTGEMGSHTAAQLDRPLILYTNKTIEIAPPPD